MIIPSSYVSIVFFREWPFDQSFSTGCNFLRYQSSHFGNQKKKKRKKISTESGESELPCRQLPHSSGSVPRRGIEQLGQSADGREKKADGPRRWKTASLTNSIRVSRHAEHGESRKTGRVFRALPQSLNQLNG